MAHVRGLVLIVLVVAPAYRLGVVWIGLRVGGRQDEVLVAGSLLAHRVTRVDPILRLCPNVELVIVFLYFGRCQPRRRQCAVASVLGSSGSAGSAQRRQHRAEQIARLYARLLHVVDVVDRVVVGGGRRVVVVPCPVLPRLVRPSRRILLRLGDLEAFLPTEVAAVLEHVSRVGVQRPEAPFARLVRGSWHFDKAVVEGQRMSGWLSFSRAHQIDDGRWKLKRKNLTQVYLFENQPSIHQHFSFFFFNNSIPYGILPPLLILSIERKQLHDESVNLRKCQHLTLRVLDRHRDQRDQAGRKEAMVR